MQYTRLGNSGPIVSRIAYGVMTFGDGAGSGNPLAHVWKTSQEADALIGRAIDSGTNVFDTADAYTEGRAETMLAQALGSRRSGRCTRKDPTGGQGRLVNFDFLPTSKEKGYDLIERMQVMAADHKATVAQLAFAWLLSKDYVSTILMGASNVRQFDDNIGSLDVKLSSEELNELDQLTKPAPVSPNWEKTQGTAVTQALSKS